VKFCEICIKRYELFNLYLLLKVGQLSFRFEKPQDLWVVLEQLVASIQCSALKKLADTSSANNEMGKYI